MGGPGRLEVLCFDETMSFRIIFLEEAVVSVIGRLGRLGPWLEFIAPRTRPGQQVRPFMPTLSFWTKLVSSLSMKR